MSRNVLVLSSDSEEEPLRDSSSDTITGLSSRVHLPKTAPVGLSKKGKKTADNVTVYIDQGILHSGQGGQILSALQAQDTQCVIQTQSVARSIIWSRTPMHVQGEDISQENVEMIILIPTEEFVVMVHNHKEKPQVGWSNEILNKAVTEATMNKQPTLVVMEMEKYFRSHKGRKRVPEANNFLCELKSRKHERKHNLDVLPLLTRKDVEEEMIDFQLHLGFHVRFLETWKEFADFVCMLNKAVAEAPIKIQRSNSKFSFYTDGEWAGGVRVDRSGKGLLEVWKRQIQQFNRISLEIANAVVAAYPSPYALIQAYNYCDTEPDRHNLLSNILVRRGEGVTSTSRRIGKEISKRIYLQLTSLDPELLLELS